MVWPIATVGYRFAAVATRMTRSTVLEVMREDYIRTAWSKGLHERIVVAKHTLRNSMLPVITIIGTELEVLLGGLVVTGCTSASSRDIPVVQSLVFLSTFVFVVVNLIVDLVYVVFDPRITYR